LFCNVSITDGGAFVKGFGKNNLNNFAQIFRPEIVQGIQISQKPRVTPMHARRKRKVLRFTSPQDIPYLPNAERLTD
jgi:hypothetical protein